MNSQVQNLAEVWPKIKNIFSVPHTEEDYLHLVLYENHTVPANHSSPVDALKYLMQEHNLKQSDLPEVGSQGVVSEILTGKRQLNIRQIKNLSTRFKVSPLVFIQDT